MKVKHVIMGKEEIPKVLEWSIELFNNENLNLCCNGEVVFVAKPSGYCWINDHNLEPLGLKLEEG